MMSMSSTDSITPLSIRESGRRVVIITIELLRGQPLSPVFTKPDTVVGLVYEHTTVEPVVVQRVDDRNTLLVFAEGENIEKLCQTLQSIEIWLDNRVYTGCGIATPEQMMLGEYCERLEEKKMC